MVADRMTNVKAPAPVLCAWCAGAGRILEPWDTGGLAAPFLCWVQCENCAGRGWT